MKTISAATHLELGASLGEAVLSLSDAALDREINRIAGALFDDATVSYQRHGAALEICAPAKQEGLRYPVSPETFYLLSAKNGIYSETDLIELNRLSMLTARLFEVRQASAKTQALQLREQLLQTQVLDQIHESVITMDLAGFILSWNRGAEKLFGYRSDEAVGKNILFLYEEEGQQGDDEFLQHGGREMEVRRRKKSGEVFWASLSLSLLAQHDQAVGMVAYLSDITHRKESEQKINHLAYFDALTNLPNRNLFKQLVDQSLQTALRKQSNCAILFIDLNRFKPVNDMLGHQVGDALLIQVAQRFRASLRDQDMVTRLGSDEFAIALPEMNQHYHASLVAQKILSCLEQIFHIDGHELRIGASIGIAVYPDDGMDAEGLLQRADIAMYKAKRSALDASGSYAFYNPSMNAHIAGKLFIEAGLRKALERQEFFLVYQPKLDVQSQTMTSVEALLRWHHPERGLISPVEFITIAEETGLILAVDAWVLERACQQAAQWQAEGVPPFRIAVNLSAKEFTVGLPARVSAVLLKYQIAPQWLELEITESMLMHSTESVIAIMDDIVALGVSLALDDFGTGYSSLSYLKRFPITSLKIDRSFVQGIPGDSNDCAIASAIIKMAHQLKLKVVAEGVETPAQLAFLKAAGCDEVQGYLFARPLPPTQVAGLLGMVF
ncbi:MULTISPECIES: putative bifunctional diguanylate cyclase/phosphodiesterase [unclassified Undibacterium]|uniref:putative bifunctional diguanylate cyclase/phosphodiesterase n=1 Tax=unclassified Undibacterium TaxID=2630295 RepID=UPI002AC921D8|nr:MULTISPECIES: EAL domain-containing protein [unclassified Undibacterium]MEB0139822.1 EAL domain-containing protein [Undibacterium sp. CCC2.1]MEB0172752.1 EAL domain-containing protein [Undibacterium sp. CCC1.1]MEB0176544.1 EAL domain-containing protein [Undibacterium sp. CCC3.4]MEB0215866.1 EAL domain-containing protein [Undibacterium sp. 5I2]WPX42716.1 EAL domain-containing protein [Undibacterium sp. CCC3.4]